MKKTIPLILTLALTLTLLTACDVTIPEALPETNAESFYDTEVKHQNIPKEYHNLLDAYTDAVKSLESGEEFYIDTAYPDLSKPCRDAIQNATGQCPYFFLAYGTKDINSDGKSELFFMKIDDSEIRPCYDIYAIFTAGNDGTPRLLFSIYSIAESAAVDESGIIYYVRSGKGESSALNMYRLLPSGEAECISYGHHDMRDWDDPDVYNYISISTYSNTYTELQIIKDEGYTSLLNTRITDEERAALENRLREKYGSDNQNGHVSFSAITEKAGMIIHKLF